jgi:hypothetical protein
MPTQHCFGSLQACRIRLARLEASGHPFEGAGNGYVSDAIVKLDVSVELSEGDDFEIRNGCGAICQTFKADDKIKRLNLSLELCQLDADLLELMADCDLFISGGNTIGWQFPSVSAADNPGVCFEVWSKAWDGTAQAVPALTSPAAAYWHWVFPKTKWTIGDVTMENDLMTVPLNGTSEENSQITQNGPFNDWPVGAFVSRVGGAFFDSAIPAATCAYTTVPVVAS